jgi:hypothetical protein
LHISIEAFPLAKDDAARALRFLTPLTLRKRCRPLARAHAPRATWFEQDVSL